MHTFDERLYQRLNRWSEQLIEKYPYVTREASLRAIEYGVDGCGLNPGEFARLQKERPKDIEKLHEVRDFALVFCRMFTSLPMLEILANSEGQLPAAIEDLLEIDDRKRPMIVKALLARNVNVPLWLSATEGEAADEMARGYIVDFLEAAKLTDMSLETYVDSGWAGRYFPREGGTGQTLKEGSRKWR